MKNKLVIVQPILPKYRVPLFEGLANQVEELELLCGETSREFGQSADCRFRTRTFKWKRIGPMHFMPIKLTLRFFTEYRLVLHVADFKFVTLWLSLLLKPIVRSKVWLHGQGGYKRSGLIHKFIYLMSVAMSSGYICYNKYSADNLKSILPRFLHHKIEVVENSLYLEPVHEVCNVSSNDLFYIGRVRNRCGLETLLEASALAGVDVRIVGDGDQNYIDELKNRFVNATFYGNIYERDEQLKIAGDCLAGAYGGDAGLSVVHYMAFGLPVIVHRDIKMHMGPEPSYVVDEVNGLLFNRDDVVDLCRAILQLKFNAELRYRLAVRSLETFNKLNEPAMHKKFATIMNL